MPILPSVPPGASAGPALNIVLVEPEQPRNVGAVMRAAANMQLPAIHVWRADVYTPDEEKAIRVAASGAWQHVALRHLDRPDTIAEMSDIVLGTSARQREGAIAVQPSLMAYLTAGYAAHRVTVLLGRESQGLTRAELHLCHGLIHLPTNPAFASMNLAQAAMIMMLDYRRYVTTEEECPAAETAQPGSIGTGEPAAPVALQERWLARFHNGQHSPQVVAQLRRLLHRSAPTDNDMAMLFNLLTNSDAEIPPPDSPDNTKAV